MNRSNPFSDFETFFDRMTHRFDETEELPQRRTGRWNWGVDAPAFPVDLQDEGETFVVTADVPGVEKDDIDLALEGRTLTLSAHRERELNEDEGTYLRHERRSESVSRRVTLPADVDAEGASATYANGVLSVTVPKVTVDADEGHRIDVE